MTERHVSRWRLPTERPAQVDAVDVPPVPADRDGARAGAVSLRYLDEFVRKLQCAPRLLEHQLFPDAKEITESMGLFNAVRRYVVKSDEHEGERSSSPLADGIVVVGDGNTPRSAALFAFRLKQWKCYSIDPAMELGSASPRAEGWGSIENLVVIRNKIENVQIKLRRAVVVLVHAHVTLAQALSAVDCEQLVGVVTMPCCNWYGKQEELHGKPPSIVYDDFSILSDHRELRVWVDPLGDGTSDALGLDHSTAMAKGCVQKEFVADFGVAKDRETAAANGRKKDIRVKKGAMLVSTMLQGMLSQDHVPAQTPGVPAKGPAASPVATSTQMSKALRQLDTHARVLVLAGDDDRGCVCVLLERGFQNVFTLRTSSIKPTDSLAAADGVEVFEADIVQHSQDSPPSVVATLCSVRQTKSDEGLDTFESSATTRDQDHFELFDVVVDSGFLFRSLRNQPKKTCGEMFEQLVHLVVGFTAPSGKTESPRLVSLSPRKDWRKPEFFANPRLTIDVVITSIAAEGSSSSSLFAYSCKSAVQSSQEARASSTSGSADQTKKKQLALQLKSALEEDFASSAGADSVAIGISDAKLVSDSGQTSEPTRVKVRGVVQHLRRFTTGPSFFSVAPPSGAVRSPPFRDHLQVSMDPERLGRWDHGVTVDAVLRLLHKGDHVECAGEMAVNAQHQPMLKLDGVRFLQSEFQAYQ